MILKQLDPSPLRAAGLIVKYRMMGACLAMFSLQVLLRKVDLVSASNNVQRLWGEWCSMAWRNKSITPRVLRYNQMGTPGNEAAPNHCIWVSRI